MPELLRRGAVAVTPSAIVLGVAGFTLLTASRVSQHLVTQLIAVIIAVLLLPQLSRYPTVMTILLIVLLPLGEPILSWLYHLGAPGGLVRGLGALKDLTLVALVWRAVSDRTPGLTRSARWALSYVGVASLYVLLPHVLPNLAQLPFSQLVLAWRVDVFFLLAFVALCTIDADALNPHAIRAGLVIVGLVVAVGAIVEHLDSSTWKHFLYTTLGLRTYSAVVLNAPLSDDQLLRLAANGSVRSGSFIQEPVYCAFYLLPAFLLCLTLVTARRGWLGAIGAGVLGYAILCTGTRSAVSVAALGAVMTVVIVLGSGRPRAHYFIPVIAAALILLPIAVEHTTIGDRLSASGKDGSSQDHAKDTAAGFEAARQQPLGRGLGTTTLGAQFDVSSRITSENAYLQAVNELGVLGFLSFVGFLIALVVDLVRIPVRTAQAWSDRLAAIALAFAMVVGGTLEQVWLGFTVSTNVAIAVCLPLIAARQVRRGREPADHRDTQRA